MAALSETQRAAVIDAPVRYALIFMEADAINRLKSGFVNKAVQSIDLKEILIGRGPKGKPTAHELFEVRPTVSEATPIDWSKMAPQTLFHTVPSALSPWLLAQLKLESSKS